MTSEEAIKVLERISEDTIQRDCSTCGRTTAGTYTGVCCYCSLCEVVPEILKDYHERKHFRSYWTWDGKRKNEALEMAISALRQEDHFREVTKKVEPLTMDELREMPIRDWVWIEVFQSKEAVSAYYMKYDGYKTDEIFWCGYPGLGFRFFYEDYGKTWLAYRQKPEEDDHA